MFGFGIFSDTEARAFHLSFALFLAFASYPAFSLLAAQPRAPRWIGRWRLRPSPACSISSSSIAT